MTSQKGEVSTKSSVDGGDDNRVVRDYAMMRLELLESHPHSEDNLKEIANQFHTAQMRLLSSVSKTLQRQECSVTAVFEKLYRRLLNEARSSTSKNILDAGNVVYAKLPKINIKPFDGSLENWVSFKQLFDSLIHKRQISNVEKLHYLLSSVQNTAYELIKNFPLTEDSYLDAYTTLSKYYDKKRQIAINYYEKLVFCDPIKSKSGSELERLNRCFTENLSVLEKYSLPDKNFMLFYLLWSKLDKATREAFQLEFNSDEIPEFGQLQLFIEKQVRALDNCRLDAPPSSLNFKPHTPNVVKSNKSTLVVATLNCELCRGHHGLAACPDFLKLNARDRYNFVKGKGLCLVCLSAGHGVRTCASSKCSICTYYHHTLLHFARRSAVNKGRSGSADSNSTPPAALLTSLTSSGRSNVLLSTAQVLVKDALGNFHCVRALLDSASACNFISDSCAQRLGLEVKRKNHTISGIGQSVTEPQCMLSCGLKSRHDPKHKFDLDALVLPSICGQQPTGNIDTSAWPHIQDILLADPDFACPGPIDMLLGADIFASCLVLGLRQGGRGQPRALNTIFGWIVMGECDVVGSDISLRANVNDGPSAMDSSLEESRDRFRNWSSHRGEMRAPIL